MTVEEVFNLFGSELRGWKPLLQSHLRGYFLFAQESFSATVRLKTGFSPVT